MAIHRIRRGLDLPLDGAPVGDVVDGPPVHRVAVVADDFPGLRPRMVVREGQSVRQGQLLFDDRSVPGVRHTAPGTGTVEAIHRGERRVLQSVVIALDRPAVDGRGEVGSPGEWAGAGAPDASRTRELLVGSGLWTALRTRPFSRVPDPASTPDAVFVTAVDTNPLAARPERVLAGREDAFLRGLDLVRRLTAGPTYLCVAEGSPLGQDTPAGVSVEEFVGPHPSGTPGLHIHLLSPVGRRRTVWSVGYQDVAAMGDLDRDGRADPTRVFAVAGPPVGNPRLVRSRMGASIADLIFGTDVAGEVRWISGSVLSGKTAQGPAFGYMGRYDVQLSALPEGGVRRPLGWLAPGSRRFSVLPVFLSRALGRRRGFAFDTDTNGSRRAMVPIGLYERVMPMDLLPTFLLRALAAGDFEEAERLGCLELDEEDLALASFVDPGKVDWGPVLRQALEGIARDR